MTPLGPLFEFRFYATVASLEAPLGRSAAALEGIAGLCDDGAGYETGWKSIRGKYRLIAVPRPDVDAVQRRISQILFPLDLALGASPHGYVVHRSTITNARSHVGARYLQKFDIRGFFGSISTDRVSSVLEDLGFGSEVAQILARLVSCGGSLPLGARTSPRISNAVLLRLDDVLEKLAVDRGLTYTRYADDLTFSSADYFDIRDAVDQLVRESGFELNSDKTKAFKHGQPMFVTGLSVEDATRPRVRKRFKSRLRQEFYYIDKYGLEEHAAMKDEPPRWLASRLLGQFHYCRAVEPQFAARILERYPAAANIVVPPPDGSRAGRARRRRQEFVGEVSKARSLALPFYSPVVSMFGS